MTNAWIRTRLLPPVLAVACVSAMSPLTAAAGPGDQKPAPPPAGKSPVIVERVENGPVFGAEVKYTQVDNRDAVLLGGYGGALFDNILLIGGAGYWQINSDYHLGTGYGGLIVEWYALRTSAVSLSARGLVGGGVSTVSWGGYPVPPGGCGYGRHGSPPVPCGGGYGEYDQAYFIFEPQMNVTVRLAPGVSLAGGVGYRVVGAANGFEDQIGGLTGTFAIRFGGHK